jgi:hypothetical protein
LKRVLFAKQIEEALRLLKVNIERRQPCRGAALVTDLDAARPMALMTSLNAQPQWHLTPVP